MELHVVLLNSVLCQWDVYIQQERCPLYVTLVYYGVYIPTLHVVDHPGLHRGETFQGKILNACTRLPYFLTKLHYPPRCPATCVYFRQVSLIDCLYLYHWNDCRTGSHYDVTSEIGIMHHR